MSVAVTAEQPDTDDARTLIDELEADLATLYPHGSRHGYSVEKLIAQGVAFFLVRDNGTPVGCGGIQLFGTDYGELKRMYVRPKFRVLVTASCCSIISPTMCEAGASDCCGWKPAFISTPPSHCMNARASTLFRLSENIGPTRSPGAMRSGFCKACSTL